MGGIGKTQLMRRLERWAGGDEDAERLWGVPPLRDAAVHTSRFDLAEVGPWDIDRLLLTARATAASAGLPTPAFDVGLSARWSVSRPGESMPDLNRQRGGKELGELVKEAAVEALAQLGIPFVLGWLTGRAVEKIESALEEQRAKGTIAACPSLGEVLRDIEQDRDGASAASIAGLLDWDLSQLPPSEQPRWVIFVDGFEHAQAAGARTEDQIRRAVFDTPHLLWVISGIRPVTWAGPGGGNLEQVGPMAWPDLGDDPDSAQHLIGELTAADAAMFLDRSLRTDGGELLLSDEARDRIVDASAGLPIYLDLSFQRALQLAQSGSPLTPDRFGQPQAVLVRTVARGLSTDERRALNAASLVRSFDSGLVAAGAAIDEGAAVRFLTQPMVTAGADGQHHLHEIVRQTVRTIDPTEDGGWGPTDWSHAADRMLNLLDQRQQDAANPEVRLRCALAAFDIATELNREPGWVLTALMEYPARARMAAAVAGRASIDQDNDGDRAWIRSVEALTACWLDGSRDEDIHQRLAAVIDSEQLSDDVRRRAVRHRAYRLRTLGDHGAAAKLFYELREEPDGDDPLLRFQYGMTLTHLGRFREADELRARLEKRDGDLSKASRLAGEIDLHHGLLAESAAAAKARADHARSRHDFHNELDNRVGEIRRRAIVEPGCLDLVDRVIEDAEQHGAIGHLRSALIAKGLCLAGDIEAVETVLVERRRFNSQSPIETLSEPFVRAFDAAVRSDLIAMKAVADLLDAAGEIHDERWLRPLLWWKAETLGEEMPSFRAVQWIESEAEVRGRWLGVVRDRAELIRAD
jgi:hypothetical protein